jgi:hypothetical protein
MLNFFGKNMRKIVKITDGADTFDRYSLQLSSNNGLSQIVSSYLGIKCTKPSRYPLPCYLYLTKHDRC